MIVFGKILSIEHGTTESVLNLHAKTDGGINVNSFTLKNEDVGDDMTSGAIVCIIMDTDIKILVYSNG
jgi:hypothetical protein